MIDSNISGLIYCFYSWYGNISFDPGRKVNLQELINEAEYYNFPGTPYLHRNLIMLLNLQKNVQIEGYYF